jgi:hypothetical protein
MKITDLPLIPVDEDTVRKFEDDLRLYGSGWLHVTSDGKQIKVEHVPLQNVQILERPKDGQ